MTQIIPDPKSRRLFSSDSDSRKGAVEPDHTQSYADTRPDLRGNLSSQLPHRQPGNPFYELTEDNDTDFPEPGSNPEHSGQRFHS